MGLKEVLDKSDGLATKWTACGSGRDQVIALEANETLMQAEIELNGGLEGGHGSATQRLRRGVYFLDTYLCYMVNFVHLNTMIHYLE